jgi:Immunoglobulin domain
MILSSIATHSVFRTFVRFALALGAGVSLHAQQLSFPGAEGFGRFSTGGRGGVVYHVTNLNDSGTGSLRAAVAASGVRTVVFDVSGTIYLASTLRITQGNLTIAGQTAPGDGICLANYPIDPSNSSNVVIRFIRSRLGDAADIENDAFSCRYATDVIVDHCSFSWSIDETASAYDNTRFTLQWCFATESLRDSVHSKGAHGYGGIWGGLGATFHHNLLAHHDSRNPRFCGARYHGTDGEYCDVRNNVIYNWRGNSTYGGEPTDTGIPSHQNLINNYYKFGPATNSGVRSRLLAPTANPASTAVPYGLFYVAGNYTSGSATITADNWAGGVQGPTAAQLIDLRSTTAFSVAPVVTQTALAAYPLVLAYGGCFKPTRDSIDARIVSEVTNGTVTYYGSKNGYAGIIDSQTDVGGWPTLATAPAPTDTDQDGMPDAWETAHGLNPSLASDRNLVDSATGYTQLELYLNALAAPAFPTPVITTGPLSQSLNAGSSLTLFVQATGSAPLSYQWYKNGAPIQDATSATYFIFATSVGDTGDYHVVVTNDYGPATSAAASVSVGVVAPAITTSPASRTVGIGGSTTFTVVATGTAPLSYQWYKNGAPIAGATTADYAIASATPSSAGAYYVIVTNSAGTATSAAATLTVTPLASGVVFSTTFAGNTIHSANPALSSTVTNWYVMSAKNATTSSVGDNPATTGVVEARPLDLTMGVTGSGVVEAAALFTSPQVPYTLFNIGDALTLTLGFTPTNVRTLGVGFFNSRAVLPFTGLNNGQLSSGQTVFATGGTQNWLGYRLVGTTATATVNLDARPAQPGTANNSQSLIIPGTSSSCPTAVAVNNSPATTGTALFTDGQSYTLVAKITRTGTDTHTLVYALYTGTDTTAAPFFSATAATTNAGAFPSAITSTFDAVGIGYRNLNGIDVSHVTVTSLRVDFATQPAPVSAYQSFLDAHGLTAGGNGAFDADPDADGLPNALEFTLGGDPTDPASKPLPVLSLDVGGDAVFTFSRHVGATANFDLFVERSSDLAAWAPLTDGVGGVSVLVGAPVGDFEPVTVRAPLAAPKDFFRLRATPH